MRKKQWKWKYSFFKYLLRKFIFDICYNKGSPLEIALFAHNNN